MTLTLISENTLKNFEGRKKFFNLQNQPLKFYSLGIKTKNLNLFENKLQIQRSPGLKVKKPGKMTLLF